MSISYRPMKQAVTGEELAKQDLMENPIAPSGFAVMPLVAHLREGVVSGRPAGWHRNAERRARGMFPVKGKIILDYSSVCCVTPWINLFVENLLLSFLNSALFVSYLVCLLCHLVCQDFRSSLNHGNDNWYVYFHKMFVSITGLRERSILLLSGLR